MGVVDASWARTTGLDETDSPQTNKISAAANERILLAPTKPFDELTEVASVPTNPGIFPLKNRESDHSLNRSEAADRMPGESTKANPTITSQIPLG